MPKRLSKTLAREIAERAMAVVNPQNRGLAVTAALQRHGFAPRAAPPAEAVADTAALAAWLLTAYGTE